MADTRTCAVPRPLDEAERLAALHRSRVLGSAPEDVFDDLVQLAAQLTGMPFAALTLLDEHTQSAKAAVGLPLSFFDLPRDDTVCAWTILQEEPLELELDRDLRTRDNEVLRRFGLKQYAGAAVRDRSGHALGALVVLDVQHHPLTDEQLDDLAALARQAAVLLEWRLARPSLARRLGHL